jgi:hypothetical protein
MDRNDPATPLGCNPAGAVASLLGLVGFVLSWIPVLGIVVGDVLGFLAVAVGVYGLVQRGGKFLALAGMGLGILTLLLKSIPILRWF